jgi:hypothetical protein
MSNGALHSACSTMSVVRGVRVESGGRSSHLHHTQAWQETTDTASIRPRSVRPCPGRGRRAVERCQEDRGAAQEGKKMFLRPQA